MCGIFGLVNVDPQQPVDPRLLRRSIDVMTYRGPDDSGIWAKGSAGFGHRRLAVLDLSPRARQPMASSDGTCVIVHNGEIYNFKTLRRMLEGKGHRFRSACDTEVILAMYQEYGIDMLSHLRGMFAFGIWDAPRRRLFLARDRFGQKPLKYFLNAEFISFASELKCFFCNSDIKPEPDEQALYTYLTYQFVPSPDTGFKSIRKLPPAHYLLWEDGKHRIERYWKSDFRNKRQLPKEQWQEALLAKLDESIRLRLASDVPVGAFLSGGVDSSAIVARMAAMVGGGLRTFSIGFEEDSHDETPYARRIARLFNTEHTQLIVRYNLYDVFPRLIWHYEEPFADSSALPTYHLSQMTARNVTVALSGDGGDELFGGYHRYKELALVDRMDWIPLGIRTGIVKPALRGGARVLHGYPRRVLALLSEMSDLSRIGRYTQMFAGFERSELHSATTPEFRAASQREPSCIFETHYREANADDPLERILSVDQAVYLPDCLMHKVDVASMAHSLECRAPFLDHELAELTASMPSSLISWA
ncbi:MAG: asparagine synthase (glutamine-hydrolyzing) [Phycisphaerae bacterium]